MTPNIELVMSVIAAVVVRVILGVLIVLGVGYVGARGVQLAGGC